MRGLPDHHPTRDRLASWSKVLLLTATDRIFGHKGRLESVILKPIRIDLPIVDEIIPV